MSILCENKIFEFLNIISTDIRDTLVLLNENSSIKCMEKLQSAKQKIKDKNNIANQDKYLDEIFVINNYVDFIQCYVELWKKITSFEFYRSWHTLQDSLDLLRIIKKFSNLNIEFFEEQLLELEKLYPYTVFLSIGGVWGKVECNICGLDMDSIECPHMRGELYNGKMAIPILKDFKEANHVSLVPNPKDKRCCVIYDESGAQYNVLQFLANLINKKDMKILNFGELHFSKKKKLNPEYIELSQTDPCFCNSGKNFKDCCIAKKYLEIKHVDISPVPRSFKEIFQKLMSRSN